MTDRPGVQGFGLGPLAGMSPLARQRTLRQAREQLEARDAQQRQATAAGGAVQEGRGAGDGPAPRPAATPWGRPQEHVATVEDFQSVGLSERDARRAHRRLVEGSALSFEDACRATTLWSPGAGRKINETRLRRLAEQFAQGPPEDPQRRPVVQDFVDAGVSELLAETALQAVQRDGVSFEVAARVFSEALRPEARQRITEAAGRVARGEEPAGSQSL